jgi:DNA-directed RNA polymerase specialized sigma24 family protein
MADSEDIALSAFSSLCQGARLGRFPQLNNRDELWRILITLTRHKTVDLIRAETSQKKGGGKVGSLSVRQACGRADGAHQPQNVPDGELGPLDLAILDDQYRHLLSRLPDETFRQIARLKIELCTVPEIAEFLNVAPRTIERKLRLIRHIAVELEERS